MDHRIRSFALVVGAALVTASPVSAVAPRPGAIVETRSRVTAPLAGKKTWREFVREDLARIAEAERGRVVHVDAKRALELVRSAELSRYYLSAFEGREEGLERALAALEGSKLALRDLAASRELTDALTPNLVAWAKRDEHELSKWRTTFARLIALGSGRGVAMRVADDSVATWLPDGIDGAAFSRAPRHGTLATGFARFLDDVGEMPASDDAHFWPFVLEVMTRTDVSRAKELSPLGRTAATGWLALNAAESLRDMEEWGPDLTRALFTARVVRALGGRVLVRPAADRWEVRFGSPSYFHVLNDGAGLSDRPEIRELRMFVDLHMREACSATVEALEEQFFIPEAELAETDTISVLVAHLYHPDLAKKCDVEKLSRAAADYFADLGAEGPGLARFLERHLSPLSPRD